MKKILVVMNARQVRLGGGIIQVIFTINDLFKECKDIRFDYAINIKQGCGIDKILQNENSTFYYLPDKSKNMIDYIVNLIQICKKGGYDFIHIHGSSSTMSIEAICAYIAGIKKIITHCHNCKCNHPVVNKLLNPVLRHLSTEKIACSAKAGEWVFGKNNFIVINNAFEGKKFVFNSEIRKIERKNIGEKTIVLGMVGNLTKQKNPEFALDILKAIDKRIDAILIYIGDGNYRTILEKKAREYGLSKKVYFGGICNDVQNKLQMIDIFLFPSLFEGLGISILEAQLAGCLSIASDNVPIETKLNDETCYLPLSNINLWIEEVLNKANKIYNGYNRYEDSSNTLKNFEKKYNITETFTALKKIYKIN